MDGLVDRWMDGWLDSTDTWMDGDKQEHGLMD